MKEAEMEIIADLITKVIENRADETLRGQVRDSARELCDRFPLYELKQLIQKQACRLNGTPHNQ